MRMSNFHAPVVTCDYDTNNSTPEYTFYIYFSTLSQAENFHEEFLLNLEENPSEYFSTVKISKSEARVGLGVRGWYGSNEETRKEVLNYVVEKLGSNAVTTL